MYWPDYSSRPRRRSRWGLSVFLGVLLGILGVALLDGWWQALLAGEREPVALPTPPALTTSPRMAGTGHVPATPTLGPTRAGATVSLAEPAPDFTLPDLFTDTTTFTLSDYRGRPVILNFWASWCVPCRREMPALQETAARYADQGVVLLGMNQTYIDDLATARAFVEELDLTFPHTRDDGGAVGSNAYQIVGIPTTVFIDRNGMAAHIQIGEMSLEQITTYTERLIAGEQPQR